VARRAASLGDVAGLSGSQKSTLQRGLETLEKSLQGKHPVKAPIELHLNLLSLPISDVLAVVRRRKRGWHSLRSPN
jgi:ABC-type proline/glycine betaine transport system ATPase subunit